MLRVFEGMEGKEKVLIGMIKKCALEKFQVAFTGSPIRLATVYQKHYRLGETGEK